MADCLEHYRPDNLDIPECPGGYTGNRGYHDVEPRVAGSLQVGFCRIGSRPLAASHPLRPRTGRDVLITQLLNPWPRDRLLVLVYDADLEASE